MELKQTKIRCFGVCLEPAGNRADISALEIAPLRELVRRERLIVLRGFQTFPDAAGFVDFAERWGEISVWPFGKVLELVEQSHPEDHIFDHRGVPLHWDGMYRPQVPEFQLFHCVKAPAASDGGRTTFSNTVSVVESAPKDVLALWKKVTGHYRRKMEFYNSETISPIVDVHPFLKFPVIRYNEPAGGKRFINRPDLEFTGGSAEELAEVHRTLRAALFAPQNFYAHEWQQGDIVIADNFSLLHGREGFETGAPRHLRRIHVLSDPPLANPRLVSHR